MDRADSRSENVIELLFSSTYLKVGDLMLPNSNSSLQDADVNHSVPVQKTKSRCIIIEHW